MPLIVRGNILQSRGRVDWLPDGNVTQPALTFVSDTDTGFYRVSNDDIAISTGGVSRLRLNPDGAVVTGNLDVTGFITGQGLAADLAISNVQICDSSWTLVDDTHVGLSEGYILVNGIGLAPGSAVQVGGVNAPAVSYVSDTQLRVQTPAKSTGTYNVTVVRGDTKTATLTSAISYSQDVAFTTASTLGPVYQYLSFTETITATSDSNVLYSNITNLPVQTTLDANSGLLEANIGISGGNVETLFSFDLKAEDEELQDAIQTFLLQYYPFAAGKVQMPVPELDAYFGGSVALSDDGSRAIVGANLEDEGTTNGGACYVYKASGGTWTLEQQILPSPVSGYFGNSVSMDSDGTRVAIGAPYDATGGSGAGAVFIYKREGTVWSLEQKLLADDTGTNQILGNSISISDDGAYVVAGANGDASNTGAAYVFARTGTTWAQQQKILPSDSEAGAQFGFSCGISGDATRLVVGAYYDDATGGAGSGAAYVFTRSGTSWAQESKLVAAASQAGEGAGNSVAIDRNGTRIVVGAYWRTVSSLTLAGAAFVWKRTGTTWAEEATFVSSSPEATDYFGYACGIDANGERVIIGSPGMSVAGVASIFVRNPGTTVWTEETKLFGVGQWFGGSCSISGDGTRALVGDKYEDAGATDAGAAYFFQRTYAGWVETAP